MRFLFDENLSVAVAIWAETTLALDVLGARAAGLAGKPDREVRRYAIEQDRILVTLDADFGRPVFARRDTGSDLAPLQNNLFVFNFKRPQAIYPPGDIEASCQPFCKRLRE